MNTKVKLGILLLEVESELAKQRHLTTIPKKSEKGFKAINKLMFSSNEPELSQGRASHFVICGATAPLK